MSIHTSQADRLAPYQGKTILITGATGYLGSALVQALSAVACRLVLLVHRDPRQLVLPAGRADYSAVQGDVADRDSWLQALPGVDYIFHLAAHEHKHGSEHNPTRDLDVNAASVLHLLEICRQERFAPKIVFASSSNLAGRPANLPVNETFPDNPLTLYAIHKLMSEKYLQHYRREFQIQSVTLRLANVYGSLQTNDYELSARVVLNRIIRKAVGGGPLTLYKNQACIRDYVFIDDVVSAFLAAGMCGASEDEQLFVLGSGEGYKIEDVVRLVAERVAARMDYTPEIVVNPAVSIESVEWRDFIADSSRFRAATGWRPQVSLVDGIDRTIDYFLQSKEKRGV